MLKRGCHSAGLWWQFTCAIWMVAVTLFGCSTAPQSDSNRREAGTVVSKKPSLTPHPALSDATKEAGSKAKQTFTFERPKVVKGLYLTAWSAGSNKALTRILGLVDVTELNSVVIDVRDQGENYFPTKVALSKEVEGHGYLAVSKPAKLMATLESHHVWPIARIACFRDDHLAPKHKDRAVQSRNGNVWRDRAKHCWLDPYDHRNWEYIAAFVDEAIDYGFPEIQLDYVRFPSEGKSSSQVFPNKAKYPDHKAKPEDVIASFAAYIEKRVNARGRALSADIFGIISSSRQDQGIGQELEKVAGPFQTVSPMVYPSHFHKGEYGIPDPNLAPYEIVKKSLADYKKRIPQKNIRPWLQAFSLGAPYGGAQIRAQIKATNDVGYQDFLLWNAGNHYTSAGLKSKNGLAVMTEKAAKKA